MASYTYTGTLTDMGVSILNIMNHQPRLTVRPEVEAWGPDGIIASKSKTVTVDPSDGAFSMVLLPSSQLTGTDGRSGVKYVLELALFDETWDGGKWVVVHDLWRFTALAGGGEIAGMGDVPPVALIVGPPWPTKHLPGAYLDMGTGDLGYYGIEVG